MKLLIIEDEPLCLQALSDMPWDTIGISVVGSAQNLKQAINIMKDTHPDIVLSDIKMPNGSGLDIAEYLYNIMPNTKIIFLTAYDNFEYVKQSFRLNVFDYILKPIDTNLILNSVKRAKESIEKALEKENSFLELEKQMENSVQFMKDYFFSLVENKVSSKNDIMRIFHIEDNKHTFGIFCIKFNLDDSTFKESVLYQRTFRELKQLLAAKQLHILGFFECFLFTFVLEFLNEVTDDDALNIVLESANISKNYLDFNFKTNYFIGVSKPVVGIENLSIAHKRALDALKYNFREGDNQILYIEDIEPIRNSIEFKTKLEEDYITAVKTGDVITVKELLQNMFNSFQANHDPIETIQQICLEFIVKLSLIMIQFNLNTNELFDKTKMLFSIKQHQTLDELHKFLLDITLDTMSKINIILENKHKNLVRQVTEFLSENFKSDVTLTALAKKLYVSQGYLSTIFTKEVGISFKKYLTNLRIDRAKYLLANTDLSIGEIAKEVGYNTQAYFSKQFNSITNMLPSTYRNEMHKS